MRSRILVLLMSVFLLLLTTPSSLSPQQSCYGAGNLCVLENTTEGPGCQIDANCMEAGSNSPCGNEYVLASSSGCTGSCYVGSGYDSSCGGYVYSYILQNGMQCDFDEQYCCC